ncbi:response regulator [Psychromonas sp. CD1]|uniref:response regulator n=1 Tax=Psychromonas sp. CD1 TaxID=1979839 RepID=UPI002151DCC0|nr:response regulator [Psychromonas sp. CD1]
MMFSYKNKKILIVDDQQAFHVMLKTILTNQGAKNITCVNNAASAIRCAYLNVFDIYLVDYNLGAGQNGIQLLDYLRNNNLISLNALYFIITGDSTKGMVLSAIEKAPDDYLMKPFSPTQLFNRLAKASYKKDILINILKALNEKDYTQAIFLCNEKIQKESKFSTICKNMLADIYITTKQYPKAEEILKQLISQRALMKTNISLGETYYLQNKLSEAIDILQDVISNKPLLIKAYHWLALAHKKNGDTDKALAILTLAANMTNHSIERYQSVALLAKEMHEYKIMINSYHSILVLSRNSFYPDPCHLANYIHSIIEHAQFEKELNNKILILKLVKSKLYQSRFEEGRNKKFDFNLFNLLCQAKCFFSLNEQLKAKRLILKSIHNSETPIKDIDNTTLCETVFSLLDISEFDDAFPYLNELKKRNIQDVSTKKNIEKYTGRNLDTRIKAFKTHNNKGIQAFKKRAYVESIQFFNLALQLEPLNSGALLNSIQVYLKQLLNKATLHRHEQLKSCQEKFNLLRNTHLSQDHRQRYSQLQKEFNLEKNL